MGNRKNITEIDNLKLRVNYLEENRRFIQNAMELVLSLGDFQEEINKHYPPELIFRETEKRIRQLIPFDARAFYLVDQLSSDINLSVCEPGEFGGYIEEEIDFMIDEGFVAWAIRERRGVCLLSRDRSRYILLHVIATHSRLRGIFAGCFHGCDATVPDISLELLSIVLRNAANAMESVEYYGLMQNQKSILETEVDRKTRELIRYERQLRRAQKMEAIGTLAGGVAHDLNNILTGIVGYPDLILMKLEEGNPLVKPVKIMKETGKKAAAIVQDLLTLARRGVSVTEVVNLNEIISEYLESPEFDKLKMYHPDVQVRTDLAPDLLNMIGSPVHMSKTVMNTVSNAAEAMPDGGHLTISTRNRYNDIPINGYDEISEGDYVLLTISDTGVGISPEDVERIFEPFYTKKIMGRSGTGLGMAVVWGTVKDHNGYIDVKSREGDGTEFDLYFPATRQEKAAAGAALTHDEYRGNGESILVVDDAREQREIARLILTELGYGVVTAAGGEEAIEVIKQRSVDLVVLDMIMDPGIDGLDTYREILKHHPGQRAIIASGFSETDRVKEAQRLGAGHYVKKPYTIDKLGVAIRSELNR